jgi:hypothetical protein
MLYYNATYNTGKESSMALTKDLIFAAADAIAADGRTPTLAKVRAALGGGSFTTISEAMTEWKASQQSTVAPLPAPAPQEIAVKLAELGADVWGIALELANAQLAAEREALEASRVELDTARQEAAEAVNKLSAELETVRAASAATIEQLQEQVARADSNAKLTHERAARAREETARIAGKVAALETQNAQLLKLLAESGKAAEMVLEAGGQSSEVAPRPHVASASGKFRVTVEFGEWGRETRPARLRKGRPYIGRVIKWDGGRPPEFEWGSFHGGEGEAGEADIMAAAGDIVFSGHQATKRTKEWRYVLLDGSTEKITEAKARKIWLAAHPE